ncbi:MAG: mechanosensitive ion channel [Vicinamibacterales bacterium]
MLARTLDVVGSFLPNLLGALAILIVGWIVALAIAGLVRAILKRTSVDNRLATFVTGRDSFAGMSVERATAKVGFYVAMLFVLVAFFQALGLTMVSDPLNAFLLRLGAFAPQLLGALLLTGVALLTATVVSTVVRRGLSGIGVDRWLAEPDQAPGMSAGFARAMYWLVLLLFLPGILGALALDGMLDPVRAMTGEMLAFLPNLIGAGLVLLVGWFAAALVARIVTNLLRSTGADAFAERAGLGAIVGASGISGLAGAVVRALLLIPVVIAALNALALDAVTTPASQMLSRILEALPAIAAAALVLGVAFVVGRMLSDLVQRAASAAGADRLPMLLGLTREPVTGAGAPSAVIGLLAMAAVMLFGLIEAAGLVGFTELAALVSAFVVRAGAIVLGVVVFAVGLYLANLAAESLAASRIEHAPLLATLARGGIILFAGSMALRATGLANEIVDLAFGVTFGAVAVAAALAFGLGSRETAGRLVEDWTRQLQRRQP